MNGGDDTTCRALRWLGTESYPVWSETPECPERRWPACSLMLESGCRAVPPTPEPTASLTSSLSGILSHPTCPPLQPLCCGPGAGTAASSLAFLSDLCPDAAPSPDSSPVLPSPQGPRWLCDHLHPRQCSHLGTSSCRRRAPAPDEAGRNHPLLLSAPLVTLQSHLGTPQISVG